MKLGLQYAYARAIRQIIESWVEGLGFHARLVHAARTDAELARWLGRVGT